MSLFIENLMFPYKYTKVCCLCYLMTGVTHLHVFVSKQTNWLADVTCVVIVKTSKSINICLYKFLVFLGNNLIFVLLLLNYCFKETNLLCYHCKFLASKQTNAYCQSPTKVLSLLASDLHQIYYYTTLALHVFASLIRCQSKANWKKNNSIGTFLLKRIYKQIYVCFNKYFVV
jgi:hypothetical protein